jgi:hypothetical protein
MAEEPPQDPPSIEQEPEIKEPPSEKKPPMKVPEKARDDMREEDRFESTDN